MKLPWKRDEAKEKDVDVLLAQANVASPTPGPTGAFRMTVEDVFKITGRGTVATGKIETGSVRVGQAVTIVRAAAPLADTTVTGVEMFRKVLDSASAGDSVGLLLADDPNVTRGDVLQS